MQLDAVTALPPELYPWQSSHQQETEAYFAASFLRKLTAGETKELGSITLFPLAFTNRSGSTLLAGLLHQAGLGIPPRTEVFNSDIVIDCSREYGIETFTEYYLRLVTGWAKAGMAGFKIGPRQLFWLARTGLLNHGAGMRLINCQRQDLLDQAISYYIAQQTGEWHSLMHSDAQNGRPAYSRDAILQNMHSITQGRQLIELFTQMHNIPRLDVYYEDLVSEPGATVTRITEFLGVPPVSEQSIDVGAISITRQSGEANRELRARFVKEFAVQV